MLRLGAWGLLLVTVGCASAPPTSTTPSPDAPRARGTLPPIPEVDGPLRIDLSYPGEGQTVAARQTFIFGSVGSGRAQLTINGQNVQVAPNGAFLGFLPVPADGVYRIQATKGTESAALEHRIKPAALPPAAPTRTTILPGSASPRGVWTMTEGERVDVSFRGSSGGHAFLVLPGGVRIPMIESPLRLDAPPQTANLTPAGEQQPIVGSLSVYRGFFSAQALLAADTGLGSPHLTRLPDRLDTLPTARALAQRSADTTTVARAQNARFELIVGNDTARAALPLSLALLEASRPRVGIAREPDDPSEQDRVVLARPSAGGVSHYFWPVGTELTLVGERGGEYRVKLSPNHTAWIPSNSVDLLPEGTTPPTAFVSNVRMSSQPRHVDVRFSTARRLPVHVTENGREVHIDIFGATAGDMVIQYGANNTFVDVAQWSQPSDSVFRFTVNLNEDIWGYRTTFVDNGDVVVQLRRPPAIDSNRPLSGLTIAVDPGHPPGGAMGPTKYTEAAANLGIGLKLAAMIQAAGGRAHLTRSDSGAVGLYARTHGAERADADLYVSVHNNAFGDGVDPFANNGTSVYYFHPRAIELARSLQNELLLELGLRDLGVGRASFVLTRPTWMPAVLTETMFLMIPEQESALRNPEVQERIATAHLRGIEAFLRWVRRIQR